MSLKEKSIKTIATGAILTFSGMVISKFLTYLYRIIVARIGPEAYGMLSLGIAVYGFISLLALFGLNLGVLRYVSLYRSKNDPKLIKSTIFSALKLGLIFSIISSIILLGISGVLAKYLFHNLELTTIFRIFAIAIPFNILLSIFLSITNAFERAQYEVYSKCIAENGTKILITFVLVLLGLGVIGATIAYTGAVIVASILALYFVQKKVFPIFNNKTPTINLNKKLISYSWPLLFSGFMMFIYLWTDTFMLGYFKGVAEVGIYNVALPTANLLFLFPYGLMTLFIPVITNVYVKKEKEVFKSLYSITTKWIFMVNLLLVCLLVLFNKQIIGILFGNEYVIGWPALVILIPGYFIAYSVYNSHNLLLMLKKTKTLFVISAISSILNLTMNFILIPKFGFIGAAIATSISYTLMGLLTAFTAYKATKVIPFRLKQIKIFLVALLTILIIHYTPLNNANSLISLLIAIALTAPLYLVLLLIFRILSKEDKMILNMFKNKFLKKSKS